MSKLVANVCFLFAFVVLLTGYGSGAANKLAKEEIEVMEQIAVVYENVKDKAGMKNTKTEIAQLNDKMSTIIIELDKLGPERRDAARAKFAPQREAAEARVKTAKVNAAKMAMASK